MDNWLDTKPIFGTGLHKKGTKTHHQVQAADIFVTRISFNDFLNYLILNSNLITYLRNCVSFKR